jgi:hypothetical protein
VGADEASPASPGIELLNTVVAELVPALVTGLANKGLPSLAEMFDWRKAGAKARAAREVEAAKPAAAAAMSEAKQTADESTELPPLDSKTMAKMLAIQSALTPEEAVLARELAGELSPPEMRAWFTELSTLPVPDAVAKIRAVLGSNSKGDVS